MKYLIVFVLAVVLSLTVSYVDPTLLAVARLGGITVIVALVSLAFFAEVRSFLVSAAVALVIAWLCSSFLGWGWAGYVVAVALGVICASLAARLEPKDSGTAKSA